MSLFNNQSDDVNFKHPEYVEYSPKVKLVYDIFSGVDTAKDYLLQAPIESYESYTKRKNVATLKNYVKRATEAFVGMIFRKPVQVVGYSDEVKKLTESIDKKSTINRFSRELSTALVRDGIVFLVVDTPIGGDGNPYMTILERGQVINWRKDQTGNYTLLVYTEIVEVPAGDFGLEVIQQWRVYKANGTVEFWRENAANKEYYLYEVIETEFDYIPIVDIFLDEIPPLYDIAKLTIKHMNRTSFKDKYLDMAAIPIPIIWDNSNLDQDSGTKPVHIIGVDEAFVFSGTKEEADFQWRELNGSSISALQDDLAVIEEDITSGVIRAAQSDNKTIKTATQSFYEAAEASNRVTVIANAVEIGLNKAMRMIVDMMNEEEDELSRVIVNKDFNALIQGSDNLRLLFETYMAGAISIQTFLNAMESFEVIDIGSVDEEIKRIESDKFVPRAKQDTKTPTVGDNMDNRTTSVAKVE